MTINKPIPGKISKREFENILKGKGSYVPKKVMDSLKASGMKRLLNENKISRQQVTKVIKTLQDKGALSKHERPGQLYQKAGIRQRDFDEAQRAATIKEHARLAIKMDIEDEAAALEAELQPITGNDRRSVLGRSVYEELNEEQELRDKKIKDQTAKKEKFDNKNSGVANKPTLVDLPDMDIG